MLRQRDDRFLLSHFEFVHCPSCSQIQNTQDNWSPSKIDGFHLRNDTKEDVEVVDSAMRVPAAIGKARVPRWANLTRPPLIAIAYANETHSLAHVSTAHLRCAITIKEETASLEAGAY